ncbi:MAG: hypothetical protein JXR88_11480 [Clostridia bacterium]|nr:hypothetical protein [Clostridia bacterium]
MYYKLHLGLEEVIPILILPIIYMLFSSDSFLEIIFLYLLIGTFLTLNFTHIKGKTDYGQFLYQRDHEIDTRLFMKMVGVQIGLIAGYSMIITMISYHVLIWHFILTNTGVMILFLRKNVKVSIYEEGIVYKGVYLGKKKFEKAYIVKNYEGKYEVYLDLNKPKIILDKNELFYVKDWVK